ncbi:alpha-galactosidase [Massarina eburnea CBS 473.64]|uniref:Alpha-galactosidase n=1 Tax=Massarina eburnea CBS 473.64 TaxID=1395130 RepID=A0A6A6RGR0_9PLEO|nr:alpha-galactosidase [Massarina eburnea CBS 473.64]
MGLLLALFASLLATGSAIELPDGVGKLPALGWNSWNAFNCDISETVFLEAANDLVNLGFKDAGYTYVNIDDCWSLKTGRDSSTGRLVPNITRFPDGINGTADKVHDMGLKIGIYSSAGNETCARGYAGSIDYEDVDAQTWADWGIDYLKYDNCNVPVSWSDECNACVHDGSDIEGDPTKGPLYSNYTCLQNQATRCPEGYDYSTSKSDKRYTRMSDALAKTGRTIQYALCQWGYAGVQYWGKDIASSWRMSRDITTGWDIIATIINSNTFMLNSVDFWGHNDMDMLEVGNGISYAESRSHFALWAAMKSPLLIGTTVNKLSTQDRDILLNKPLLAFNQDDEFGKPAVPYKWGTNPDWSFNQTWPAEYYSGHSKAGTMVLLFNPGTTTVEKTAVWAEIPGLTEGAKYSVTDVWTGEDKGCVEGGFNDNVESHDTHVYLVKEGCGGKIDKSDRTLRLHD